MKGGRYRDHAPLAIRRIGRSTQYSSKSRPIDKGFPVDNNQLCGQAIFFTLPHKVIDKNLSSNQRVPAMIIVTRGGDYGEIRCSIILWKASLGVHYTVMDLFRVQ